MIDGPDGINDGTIRLAAAGVAAWLQTKAAHSAPDAPNAPSGVVVAHDTRHGSEHFAGLTADVLAGQGISVWRFADYQPTPVGVFAIRRLNAAAGIVITASHNPSAYNGFKVYDSSGIQIGSTAADSIRNGMLAAARTVLPNTEANPDTLQQRATQTVAIRFIGDDLTAAYCTAVQNLWQLSGDTAGTRIVYTPMHGTGGLLMQRILTDCGFEQFIPVPEQMSPDPDFTTSPEPNPEQPAVLERAARLAAARQADLVLATDPDADRAAVMLPDGTGRYIPLTGNETGALLLHLLLKQADATGVRPDRPVLVKSVVTDDFGATVARSAGLEVLETLTGFKNICGVIPALADAGKTFVFGYEESIGFAFPGTVRDKDGLAACRILAGAAATFKKEGRTLFQVLMQLRQQHGFYQSNPFSLSLDGPAGKAAVEQITAHFRTLPIRRLGSAVLDRVQDFDTQTETFYNKNGAVQTAPLAHPKQNLLRCFLTDGTWFAVRPSGTEPKLKFYLYTRAADAETAASRSAALRRLISEAIETAQAG